MLDRVGFTHGSEYWTSNIGPPIMLSGRRGCHHFFVFLDLKYLNSSGSIVGPLATRYPASSEYCCQTIVKTMKKDEEGKRGEILRDEKIALIPNHKITIQKKHSR
ncbi:unnamed protein product [Cuscuta epithymum]|uniref:Uncharacterized protein n=1 Tax=Cuscuta epithymum TaxID=186058 RepID=A0AAV0F864_9ASTE|nr:unnamed protein product [Cuscuta epithymum]